MQYFFITISTIILAALIVFLSFMALNNFFTFEYLMVEYNLNRIKEPQKYPHASLWQFGKQCTIEYMYVMGKFYLYPWQFADLSLNTENNTAPKYAILLIHGYNRNQTDWMWFRKQIADLKYPIYTINLKPDLGSIPDITTTSLAPKIAQIKQDTKCDKVILIGHSMGGLVASYYSEYMDKDKLIAKIICIASPLHGTKLSVLALGENAEQMLPDSSFTTELRNKIAHSRKKYNFVASKFDNIVFPWQSELLDNKENDKAFTLDSTSHLALLHSNEVVNQIYTWISETH